MISDKVFALMMAWLVSGVVAWFLIGFFDFSGMFPDLIENVIPYAALWGAFTAAIFGGLAAIDLWRG